MPKPYRVYMCDDVEDLRALVRLAVDGDPDLDVIGEAADGADCLEGIA